MRKFIKFTIGFFMLPTLFVLAWSIFYVPMIADIFAVFLLLSACTACGLSFMDAGSRPPFDY